MLEEINDYNQYEDDKPKKKKKKLSDHSANNYVDNSINNASSNEIGTNEEINNQLNCDSYINEVLCRDAHESIDKNQNGYFFTIITY